LIIAAMNNKKEDILIWNNFRVLIDYMNLTKLNKKIFNIQLHAIVFLTTSLMVC